MLARTPHQVRQDKIAYSLEEMTVGAASVAAPIFGPDGGLRASLALIVRSSTNVKALAAAVRTAALGITRELGRQASGARSTFDSRIESNVDRRDQPG